MNIDSKLLKINSEIEKLYYEMFELLSNIEERKNISNNAKDLLFQTSLSSLSLISWILFKHLEVEKISSFIQKSIEIYQKTFEQLQLVVDKAKEEA